MVVATCTETPTIFERKTVADGTGIAIGTLMTVSSDPNTITANTGDGTVFGGIAWEEKTASDGITEVTVAMDGVWDIACAEDGATLGAMVVMSGANLIRDAIAADLLTGAIVGKTHETGTAAEVIRVKVGSLV